MIPDSNKEWERQFGNKTVAFDFEKREIHKEAYGQSNSRFGWDFDHILPKDDNGTDTLDNIQIVHVKTNDEKSNKSTFVSGNGKVYQVKKRSKTPKKDWAGGYDYSKKKYCMVEIKYDN